MSSTMAARRSGLSGGRWPGQVGQGKIQSALQFGDLRQRRGQGVADRLIRRGIGKIATCGKKLRKLGVYLKELIRCQRP